MNKIKRLDQADHSGYIPDLKKRFTTWFHRKTSTQYVITGFGLNAKTGLWEYEYKEPGGFVTYHREPREWHEVLEDGRARFVEA